MKLHEILRRRSAPLEAWLALDADAGASHSADALVPRRASRGHNNEFAPHPAQLSTTYASGAPVSYKIQTCEPWQTWHQTTNLYWGTGSYCHDYQGKVRYAIIASNKYGDSARVELTMTHVETGSPW